MSNLLLAWRRARKGKTKKPYVIEFEKDVIGNLFKIHEELKNQTYCPKPLKTFILRDPKTRKISKSAFRDRIVHHALVLVIEPIFDKSFIYDSCANRVGKGTLFAIKRFDEFKRKVTANRTKEAFCLKADIRHYFNEINHEVLLKIIKRKIKDEKVIWLIKKIVANISQPASPPPHKSCQLSLLQFITKIGMPLGNLTSQFFANVYLNELDYFVKHKLKAKYYIRYVDDFVILHKSKKQLLIWKAQIDEFLRKKLKIKLHPDKSMIVSLIQGVDFVGFRIFYNYKLLRKRNIRKIFAIVEEYRQGEISKNDMLEIFQGWQAYSRWANCFKLRKKVVRRIYEPLQ